MINFLSKRKKSEQLHKATWIHFLDSGGQPQFVNVSWFFLHGNAIDVIVTKLTEGLLISLVSSIQLMEKSFISQVN